MTPLEEKIIKEFREKYVEAYRDVLPRAMLGDGNKWFENFILSALSLQREEFRKKIEEYFPEWPESQPMYMEYDDCRKKRRQEIKDLLASLEEPKT